MQRPRATLPQAHTALKDVSQRSDEGSTSRGDAAALSASSLVACLTQAAGSLAPPARRVLQDICRQAHFATGLCVV